MIQYLQAFLIRVFLDNTNDEAPLLSSKMLVEFVESVRHHFLSWPPAPKEKQKPLDTESRPFINILTGCLVGSTLFERIW